MAIVSALTQQGFTEVGIPNITNILAGSEKAPDIFIDNSVATLPKHIHLKGDFSLKAHGKEHETFTVRLNQPDIHLETLQQIAHECCVDSNMPANIGEIDQFGADLSIIYSHQKLDLTKPLHGNVLVVDTVPTRITHALIAQEEAKLDRRYQKLKHPVFLLAVGERVDQNDALSAQEAQRAVHEAATATKKAGGSLVVVTAPRTCEDASAAIESTLKAELPSNKYIFHDYKKSTAPNPYVGMLGKADRVIITSDSMSMLSDAVAAGKPLFVFERSPSEVSSQKCYQTEYMQLLKSKGYIQEYATLGDEKVRPIPAYNSAQEIASCITRAMAERHINNPRHTPLHINAPDFLADATIHSPNMDAIHAAYRGHDRDGVISPQQAEAWQTRALQGLVHSRNRD